MFSNPIVFKKVDMSVLKDKYISTFEAAEIARFTPEEREAYEDSLKYYRDLKNVVDTSRHEGIKAVAKEMKANGEPIEKIMKYTNLSREEIEEL